MQSMQSKISLQFPRDSKRGMFYIVTSEQTNILMSVIFQDEFGVESENKCDIYCIVLCHLLLTRELQNVVRIY